MNGSSRSEALLRGMAVVEQADAGLHGAAAAGGDPRCACLAWALAALDDPRPVLPCSGSFAELLECNNVPHRQVRTPADLARSTRNLLVVFDGEADRPLVVQRRGGRTLLFDPRLARLCPLPPDLALKPYAYELYASLPVPLRSPLRLLTFSLATHRTALATVVFSALVVAVFNLCIPTLTSFLVGTMLPQGDRRLILETSLVVLLIALSTLVSQAFSSLATVRLESLLNLRIETALWSHLLRQPLAFFRRLGSADLIQRVGAIGQMRQLLSAGLLSAGLGLLFSLSNLALMVFYEARLALVASLFSLICALIMGGLVLRAARLERPLQEGQARAADMALQAVVGMPQIRVSGSEPFVFEQWIHQAVRLGWLLRHSEAVNNSLEILARVLNPLGQVVIFTALVLALPPGQAAAAGGGAVQTIAPLSSTALMAAFVSFQAAYLSFNSQLSALAVQVANSLARLIVLWERSSVVMHATPEPGYGPGLRVMALQGRLQIADLRAGYGGGSEPVLRGVNLEIPQGSYTAITGPSGCGKTTLLRCLLRLVEPEAGVISVDGVDLRDLAVRAYRRQLGVVLQNAPLPTGSIYEIVRAGRPFSREEVWHALEQAAIADDVLQMPMQLETLISEGGTGISGGQRQRLSLARALLAQPRILLLDEATSALDAPTQAAVTRTLASLAITRIAIAHRLSTLERADQIAVLRDGVIAELGSFELLRRRPDGYLAPRGGGAGPADQAA